ncbi:hypothetical protein F1847_07800 [Thermodesulfobacterium sp. TA1]|uniref:hypothetical protein n=1 Tax=Thermodesulfobacterium sp. TA1 TaxID=2234087 RepID=UPI001232E85C|nr:hypothetical protein [Thermodesulfobacterium sp. TA1]QER42644.1 hypothetical protein F1847_07800 [Thermodesulfobacterium sp. TA1]
MEEEKKGFFDYRENIKKFLKGFYLFLVLLIGVDFFVHKHAYFGFDGYPSFYGAFGFVACVWSVLIAKHFLRPLVMRREDYYGD